MRRRQLLVNLLALSFMGVTVVAAPASADRNETAVASPNALNQASISSGGFFTCAIESVGSIKCWGANNKGQLGDGTTSIRTTLVSVTGLADPATTPATGISLGWDFACSVFSDSSARCWGEGSNGQLGNGATADSSTPVAVTGLTTATAISAADLHACALLSNGSVMCWGEGSNGQLGDGASADSSTPVMVTGLATAPVTATAISAGGSHTCALLSDGSVKCWGLGTRGQLGNGGTVNSPTPVAVTGLTTTATAISAGGNHSCALLSDGSVMCWGYNFTGQLGDGGTANSPTPVTVTGLTTAPVTATAISLGTSHSCALLSNGSSKCWGQNGGRLGNGSDTQATRSSPVSVLSPPTRATAISAGNGHTCVVSAANAMWCWGQNSERQLGDGSNIDKGFPTRVSTLGAVGTVLTPGVPGTPTGVAGDGRATVTVAEPTSGGGPTSYLVTSSPDSRTCTVTEPATSCEVTGLTNGTSYTFTSTATNTAGTSTASAASAAVTPTLSAPGQPGRPRAVAGDGQVTVTIVAPSTGGTPASYTVTASSGGRTCTVTVPATSCVVTGLTNGTSYTFTSRATNTAGTSTASLPTTPAVTPRPPAPGAPGTPTVVAGDGQVTVTIVAPSAGGTPVSYTVTASPGGRTCTVTVPETSCVVTGLTNGTSYTFTSTATNTGGTSAASAASAAATPMASGRSASTSTGADTGGNSSGGTGSSGSAPTPTGAGTGGAGSSGGSAAGSGPDSVSVRIGTSGADSRSRSGAGLNMSTEVTKRLAPTANLPTPIAGTVLNGRPSSDVVASASASLTTTDNTVYSSTLPTRTAASTALKLLTPSQARTAEILTLSPAVCVGAETDLVLIGPGRCDARVVSSTTNDVLRVLSTTVVADSSESIKVGNKVVVLAPYFFSNGTTKMLPKSLTRFNQGLSLVRQARMILVTGHSGNVLGLTPGNKALANNRADTVAGMLKEKMVRALIVRVGMGPLYPVTTDPKRQTQNRRVVVVLIP